MNFPCVSSMIYIYNTTEISTSKMMLKVTTRFHFVLLFLWYNMTFSRQEMSSSFRLHRKLAYTKTQQIIDKSSKHSGKYNISRVLVLLMHAWTGVVSTLSYHVFFVFVLFPSEIVPTSLIVSTSPRVCRHQ